LLRTGYSRWEGEQGGEKVHSKRENLPLKKGRKVPSVAGNSTCELVEPGGKVGKDSPTKEE